MDERIISIGSSVYALIFSIDEPEILIPVRADVMDIDFKTGIPIYYIRISWFYCSKTIWQRYFVNGTFISTDSRTRKLDSMLIRDCKTTTELLEAVSNHRFQVYSPFIFRKKAEMVERYSSISLHMVIKNFHKIRDILTNSEFTKSKVPLAGVKDYEDFMKRIGKGFIDLFPSQEAFFKFSRLYLMNHSNMKKIKSDRLI